MARYDCGTHDVRDSSSRLMRGGWVDPDSLPRTADGVRAQCRWCSQPVNPPRQTFCSATCVHEHKLRTSTTYARRCVYSRDRGVCAQCRADTKQLAKQVRTLQEYGRWSEAAEVMAAAGVPTTRKVHGPRKLGGGLWDADHVVGVWENGGQAGLDALQTLCIPCHKAKTREQAAERARLRRLGGGTTTPPN